MQTTKPLNKATTTELLTMIFIAISPKPASPPSSIITNPVPIRALFWLELEFCHASSNQLCFASLVCLPLFPNRLLYTRVDCVEIHNSMNLCNIGVEQSLSPFKNTLPHLQSPAAVLASWPKHAPAPSYLQTTRDDRLVFYTLVWDRLLQRVVPS